MRSIVGFLVILCSTTSNSAWGEESPYAREVLRDGPQVYLRFDELKPKGNKTVLDATGKHEGRVAETLAAAEGAPGIGGRAATFDGRTSLVTIAHDAALASSSLSVEFWLRSKQAFDGTFWPGSATLVSKALPGPTHVSGRRARVEYDRGRHLGPPISAAGRPCSSFSC